jgi:hypothetical protein
MHAGRPAMADARQAVIRVAALKALLDKVKTAYDQARVDALEALSPGDRLHAALPDGADIGTVTVVDGRTSAKVTNPAALLEWVRVNAPDEVEQVPRVRESYVGALLSRCENVDGAAMHAKTGELLPGVRFETGDPYARVTQTTDQLAAFVAAWAGGDLPPLPLLLESVGTQAEEPNPMRWTDPGVTESGKEPDMKPAVGTFKTVEKERGRFMGFIPPSTDRERYW